MTDEEQHEAMKLVVDYARGLGLYGVIILSRRCEACNDLHDFEMMASITQSPVALLNDFAAIAEHGSGRIVPQWHGKH